MSQPQQLSFIEYYQVLRNQIVLSYDGAKELALKNFDAIAKKLEEQLTINEKNKKNESNDTTEPSKA